MRAQRTQKEQKVQLTVRGMARGAIRMEAEDGTIYTCAKDNARGALFGDTVLAERIGRDRVVVAKVVTHAHENIMGVLRVHDGVRVIQPLERRLPAEIAVADSTPRQKTAKSSARMLPAGKMKAAYVSASKIESAVLSRRPARLMRW